MTDYPQITDDEPLMNLSCFIFQRKERAEQVAYKLEQDLALCK